MISVIVPVYNTRTTLSRCVDSILAQTYSDFEIILVDDGSPDGASKLCDQLAAESDRIRVLHQANAGLSAARNAGIKAARGEYLTFVDSDDTIAPEMLTTLMQLVTEQSAELAICSFAEVSASGQHRDIAVLDDEPHLLTTAECLQHILNERGFTMSACGKLYARRLFQKVNFPVGKLYEDVGTTYRLVMQCDRIACRLLPLYHYYQNPTSIIHQEFGFERLALIEQTDTMCDVIQQKYPTLQDTTNLRRMHARFSILRQLLLAKPAPADRTKMTQLEQEIIQYLRTHRAWVLQNPETTRRDHLAMRSLLLGRVVFKFAWKFYSTFK